MKKNTSQNNNENLKQIKAENISDNLFKYKINSETYNKYNILNLQQKLKDEKIIISDLTNEQLDQIILLYKKQINNKKNKLKNYRRIIFGNKK